MIIGCPVPAAGEAFLSGLLVYLDCQAQNLGAGGYQALAAPGSVTGMALTGLLTLFVALFGIRMMIGHAPNVQDGVLAVAKIGLVLLLATSWPAYRSLAYDVVLRGPAELAGAIGQPAGLPGANGPLAARLQNADNMIVALTRLGIETPPQQQVQPQTPPSSAPALVAASNPAADPAFGIARIAYLAGTIGAFAVVRLVAGLLLALAPLFAGLLLFEATRPLFAGWLRGLAATVLGALGVAVVLGVELALLEPWLAGALAQREALNATPAAAGELLVITLVFVFTLFAVIAASVRIAFTVHVSGGLRRAPARLAEMLGAAATPFRTAVPAATREGSPADAAAPSHAFRVADAVAAMQHRESASATARSTGSNAGGLARGDSGGAASMPGQLSRRTRMRVSTSAARRDGRS